MKSRVVLGFGCSIALLALSACQAVAGIKERNYVDPDASSSVKGTGGKSGGKADASTDGAVASTLCDTYCKQVTDQCTGDYATYASVDACLPVCNELKPGASKDVKGNTVGCRLNAARSVVEKADCAIAGPGGAGTCGDNCESYCTIVSQACSDDAYTKYWLGDVEQCIEKCHALRDRDKDPENSATDSRYSAKSTEARDHNGDTVQCRLFHASVASSPTGASTHCWHAAIAPRPSENGEVNPCLGEVGQVMPRCKDYCHLVATACQDDLAVYDSEEQCQALCADGFDPGKLTDQSGNTLGCRSTHAYNALVGGNLASVHCGHSGPSGGAACGGDCGSYCSLLERTCSAQLKELGGMSGCMSECQDWLSDSFSYSVKLAKSGSSPLACRFYALTKAHAEPSSTAKQCDLAIGKGGC